MGGAENQYLPLQSRFVQSRDLKAPDRKGGRCGKGIIVFYLSFLDFSCFDVLAWLSASEG